MLAMFLWTIAFSITTLPVYASSKFTDINGHWAQSQIENLTAQNIISGYPDGTFKPDKIITRAEFVTLLVKAFKLEIKTDKVFNDTANHWAKDYIATANAFGIANGYSNDIFGPNDPITREQMTVMIVRVANLQSSGATLSFSDSVKVSDWAKDAVVIASANKIIKGFPDGSFQPLNEASRAQAVIVISAGMAAAGTIVVPPADVVTALGLTADTNTDKAIKLYQIESAMGNLAIQMTSSTEMKLDLRSYDVTNNISTSVVLTSGQDCTSFSIVNTDGTGTVAGVTFAGAIDGKLVMTFGSAPSAGDYMILGSFVDGDGITIFIMQNVTIE
jgi:hypothetical protein